MKLRSHTFDPEADAAYGYLGEGAVAETEEVAPGIIVDWNQDGRPVGVEVLDINARAVGGDLASYLSGLTDGLFAERLQPRAEAAEQPAFLSPRGVC